MQIGVQVPHRGPMTDPACIQAIVSEGEALGYEVLIVSTILSFQRISIVGTRILKLVIFQAVWAASVWNSLPC